MHDCSKKHNIGVGFLMMHLLYEVCTNLKIHRRTIRWPTRDMLRIIKRFCKLNKVATHLKKLLQIFKTSCCKIKHQKYARALKEGGVGIRIFIFLSGNSWPV